MLSFYPQKQTRLIMSSTFDTFKFVKGAMQAGFTEDQAAFQAEEISKLLHDEIATKQDIKDLQKDMHHLKNEILIKLGGLMVVGMGILGFILKH
jgi:hypothetical protein